MTEKDYHLYGTKVLNLKTQESGLLICTWKMYFDTQYEKKEQ